MAIRYFILIFVLIDFCRFFFDCFCTFWPKIRTESFDAIWIELLVHFAHNWTTGAFTKTYGILRFDPSPFSVRNVAETESFELKKINISSLLRIWCLAIVSKLTMRRKKVREKLFHSAAMFFPVFFFFLFFLFCRRKRLFFIAKCFFGSAFFCDAKVNCVLFIFSRHKLQFFVFCILAFLLVGRLTREILEAFSVLTQWSLCHTQRTEQTSALLYLSLCIRTANTSFGSEQKQQKFSIETCFSLLLLLYFYRCVVVRSIIVKFKGKNSQQKY